MRRTSVTNRINRFGERVTVRRRICDLRILSGGATLCLLLCGPRAAPPNRPFFAQTLRLALQVVCKNFFALPGFDFGLGTYLPFT